MPTAPPHCKVPPEVPGSSICRCSQWLTVSKLSTKRRWKSGREMSFMSCTEGRLKGSCVPCWPVGISHKLPRDHDHNIYRIIKQQGFSSHCSKLRFQDVLCLQDKDIVVPRGRWRAIDVQIVKTLFSVFYQCSLLFLLHEIMHHMESSIAQIYFQYAWSCSFV